MGAHDSADVLTLGDGEVTWETCCGDTPLGTYEKLSDGIWAWHFVMDEGEPVTNEFVLEPGFLWLTCYQISSPTNTFRLRHRLSAPGEDW